MREHDRIWLQDSPENRMIINSFCELERMDLPALRRLWRERVIEVTEHDRFHRFRRRVVKGPRGFYWELDPTFDIDRHIVPAAVQQVDDEPALQDLLGQIASEPLPRDRPPWQVQLMERYGADSSVFIVRMHHCMGDGIGFLPVLFSLFDPVPELESAAKRPQRLVAKSGPSRVEALIKAPLLVPSTLLGRALSRADRNDLHGARLSGTKRVAWTRAVDLELVRRAKRQFGVTVNDVLMASVGGAFARLFARRGAPPVDAVRVSMPVSMRTASEPPRMENRFATVLLSIPSADATIGERIAITKRRLDRLKRSMEPLTMYAAVKLALTALPEPVSRWLVDLLAGKCTCVVTNVPGPEGELAMMGRKVRTLLFWVPQRGSIGVGISIFSQQGRFRVGVISDAAMLDRPQELVDAIEEEFDELATHLDAGG